MGRLLTLVLALASFGLLILLAVVRLGSWTPRWWLEAVDTFALYAFAPFLLTIVLSWALRSRVLLAVSIAAVALFAHQFGGQVLSTLGPSDRAASAEPAAHIRVLTLNLYGSAVEREALVELLRTWQPDVVLLQEVTPRYAELVRPATVGEYPYGVEVGLDNRFKGGVTWSRLPLGPAERLNLGISANALHRVSASTPIGDVWFYNVHLANPTSMLQDEGGLAVAIRRLDSDQRDLELGRLAAQTANVDAPYVLAGDFNVPAGSRAYRDFPPAWRDAYAEVGRGFGHTFPATVPGRRGAFWSAISLPLLRIDYVLSSQELRPRAAWTRRVAGSDHLAVIVDLEPSDAP